MSLLDYINRVKILHPLWKSQSRIIGRASEIYSCENIKCIECDIIYWLEYDTNEKSKDQVCKKCNKKYQIKCKKITERFYEKLKKETIFKTVGAEYNTTLNSLNDKIDYIIILYSNDYNILDIIHVKDIDITQNNIIPRKPLGKNARRAGWQGCYLYFENFTFVK